MKNLTWAGITILIIGLISSLLSSNLAIVFFSEFWLILGSAAINFFFEKESKTAALKIFVLFYFVYFVYAFAVDKIYIANPRVDYFISIDSFKFYSYTEDVLHAHKSLFSVYVEIFNNFIYSDSPGYYYLSATIGYFANIIGTNNYFIQQLVIVFLTAFIPVFLYKIALIYFDHQRARKIAITFGLFTHIVAYSATLLRDIHIAFLFIIAFYLLLTEKGFIKLAYLMLIGGIVWSFRVENGIFFLGIIGLYCILFIREHKKRPIKFIPIILLMLGALVFILLRININNLLLVISGTTDRYAQSSMDTADQNGLGVAILKLPHGPRELGRLVVSQISPFPAYIGFNTSLGVFKMMAFTIVIATSYWFFTWFLIISAIIKKNFREIIPFNVKVAFFIAILLILAGSLGTGDFRRLMCVYPIVYLVAAFFFFSMKKAKRISVIKYSIILYIGLHILYASIKL